jgi:hexulose-6-phosphate isomerase
VGNVLLYGYPQDWIRTLGKRIVKLHVKDFKLKDNTFEWVDLGDGDADWTEVRKALSDIGYSGSAIAEFKPRDEAYLRDLSRRMDQLILGKA